MAARSAGDALAGWIFMMKTLRNPDQSGTRYVKGLRVSDGSKATESIFQPEWSSCRIVPDGGIFIRWSTSGAIEGSPCASTQPMRVRGFRGRVTVPWAYESPRQHAEKAPWVIRSKSLVNLPNLPRFLAARLAIVTSQRLVRYSSSFHIAQRDTTLTAAERSCMANCEGAALGVSGPTTNTPRSTQLRAMRRL